MSSENSATQLKNAGNAADDRSPACPFSLIFLIRARHFRIEYLVRLLVTHNLKRYSSGEKDTTKSSLAGLLLASRVLSISRMPTRDDDE